MTSDISLFIKKIRYLNLALIVSGALNIGILSFLLYWGLRENPPTPYCELKPAKSEEQQIPLADQRGCAEMLAQLSQLSFSQLINSLSNTQLIENGYAERDLALACLVGFHHFDLQRALSKNSQPEQKRLLTWRAKGQDEPAVLAVYPDLTQQQFDSLIQFARTERWPLTAEGLFILLKEQNKKGEFDDHLVETFVLTPEFWTVEFLFNRAGQKVNRQTVLSVLLQGDWSLLRQFVDQQRQIHDSSGARRQKFLLDYLKVGSSSAAMLLLKIEWEFAVKKLDDQQVIAILHKMPENIPESMLFAKEMLTSPRSTNVWQQASEWLYNQVGESMPKQWTHHAALMRFVPEKASVELVSKPQVTSSIMSAPLPVVRSVPTNIKPVQPKRVLEPSPVIAKTNQKKMECKNLGKIEKTGKPSSIVVSQSQPQPLPSQIYVVQEGDSLWKISQRFGLKVDDVKSLNHLKSDALKIGTVLKLPKQVMSLPPKKD